MKPNQISIILFTLAILVIGCTFFFYSNYYLLDYKEVKADFHIEERTAGINADTDALHFGGIPLKGYSKRSITLTSKDDSRVSISFDPPVDWLSVDKNDFLLKQGEQTSIEFLAKPISGEVNETFNTTVKVYFYRSFFN